MSVIYKAISAQGGVSVMAADTTDMIQTMEQLHKPSADVTAALGRLLTASALMAADLKDEKHAVTLRLAGDGPAGMVLAVANGAGQVKGYVENPVVQVPPTQNGKLNVKGAVGENGMLYVVRNLGLREPYVGMVPIVSGEVAEDITYYYAVSEQVPAACALGVLVDKDLSVLKAGGYLLRLLPDATEEEKQTIEQNITAMASVTALLQQGKSAEDLIEMLLAGLSPQFLESGSAAYHCDCHADRFAAAIRSLGAEELTKLAQEDKNLEVVCQFCNKQYSFDAGDLLQQVQQQRRVGNN